MKRIVILCDGTWNEPVSQTPTNVVQIAQLMKPVDSVGVAQVPIYIEGVGTGRGVGKLARITDRVMGGALGWGLYRNVVDAYRHLVFLYEPGDEIYIFGFSRGAYTARSLTGLIRSTGIIPRENLFHLPEAVNRYQDKNSAEDTHPNSDDSHAFRARMSPEVVTSKKEQDWRKAKGEAEVQQLKVNYLGVWDSVGALGVPNHLLIAGLLNRRKYRFHDAALSSMVLSARHAVALDERRRTFEPTHWTNIDEMNLESEAPGLPYQEVFFLGDHGSVGGGGDLQHLSSISLRWVIRGAQDAGLEFDAAAVHDLKGLADPHGPLINKTEEPGLLTKLLRISSKDREGPKSIDHVHHTVLERWRPEAKQGRKLYRPGSLSALEPDMLAYFDAMADGPNARPNDFA